jgi:asparagine synthase (glutamine-hydrolysing)
LHWRSWQTVNENGVRVLLDGYLGDNVVSYGIEYLNELANQWRWVKLAIELKQLIEHSNQNIPLLKTLYVYFLQHGIRPYIPEVGLRIWRKVLGYDTDPTKIQASLFSLEYCIRSSLRERLFSTYQCDSLTKSTHKAHLASLNKGLIQTGVEIYNKGCSAFHYKTRFPFLDKRVVEFCLAIAGSQKINHGYTRIILRRALYEFLPEEIRWRSDKGNLGWSFIAGFKTNQELVHTIINSSQDFLCAYFNSKYLNNIYNRYKNGAAVPDELVTLFVIASLSAWNK